MKKLIIMSGLFFFSLSWGQTPDKKQIIDDMYTLTFFLAQREYGKVLDLTHPKAQDEGSREQYIAAMKTVFEGDEDMKVTLYPTKREDFEILENIKISDEAEYALVYNPLFVDAEFLGNPLDEAERKTIINLFKVQGVKGEFINDNTVKLKMNSLTIAVKDGLTQQKWRYIYHDESNAHYSQWIPMEVIKKARKYLLDKRIKQEEDAN